MIGVFIKTRNLDIDTHSKLFKDEGRVDTAEVKECQIPANHQKLGERHRTNFFFSTLRRN